MRLISDLAKMKAYIKKVKQGGKSIGFVPTMGYLHEGHLSLMRQARKDEDIVVISIFVNPTQFRPDEDYKRYPRDLERDKKLAKEVGVDLIFAPSTSEMYPKGYSSYVNVGELTEPLCGRFRPGHFRGVTTVCLKLFNIVKPDVAYFGQKDAQQAIVIKRMVRDLNLDLKIKVLPIVRERDGLAMSSRNTYLTPKERNDALCLYRSLKVAKQMIASGSKDPAKVVGRMKRMIAPKVSEIDYISIVETRGLNKVKVITGEVLIALAVWIGKKRLIDNIIVK